MIWVQLYGMIWVNLHAQYDWTIGVPGSGNEFGKLRVVPPCVLSFCALTWMEREGL